ncbi:DNA-binding transcription factor Adn3 [Schizosaccharomyces osmophilus]|uniref:DNA-binding transcription factor Adn3 n=1 Tax=Schizosaccharomyces osmophilus TaxID=2545709 RepID=A0AAE9WKC0_9SCHI|nr:DNA-binding transcription factor Adn3 [Schizosaccharomyces osmophilus]WBW75413.1 DNA-binding transcription factor Adn3 [Schizosaccharomyces osmophilus]
MTEYMDIESSSTSNSKPQNPAETAADSLHPKESLDYYIYDYFVKHKFQETAKSFIKESKVQIPSNGEQNATETSSQVNEYNRYDQSIFGAANGKSEQLDSFDMNIPSNTNPTPESQKDASIENKKLSTALPAPSVAIDIPEGFLVEWFNIFWDVFSARVSRVNSSAHLYDSQSSRSVYRGHSHTASTPVPSTVPHMRSSNANPLNYASSESKNSESKPYLPFSSAVPKSDPAAMGNIAKPSQKYGSLLPAGTGPNPAMPYSLGAPAPSVPPNYLNTSMLSTSPPRSFDPNNHPYPVGRGMSTNSSRNGFYPPTPAQIHQLKSQQEYLQRQSKQMSEPAANFNQNALKDPQMPSNEQPAMNPASGIVNPTARNSASPIITQASSGMGGGSSPFYAYQSNTRETASVPAIKPSPNIMIQPRYPASSEALANDMQKYRVQNSVEGMPPHMPQSPATMNGKYGTNPAMGNRLPPYVPNYYRGQLPMSSPHPPMYEANTAGQGPMEYTKARELAMRRGQTPNMATLPKDAAVPGEANNVNLGNPLTDYHMQLMILEEQNKKRLLMARQEGEREFLSPQTHERFDHEIKNSQLKPTTDRSSHLHPKSSGGMNTQVKGSDVSTTGFIPPNQKQPGLPVQHSFMNVPPNEQSNIIMSQYLNRTKQPETPLDAPDFRDANMTKKVTPTSTASMNEQDRMASDIPEKSNSWHVQNSENTALDAKEISKYQPPFTQSSQPELPCGTSADGNQNPDSQAFLEPIRDNQSIQKGTMRDSDIASSEYPSMSNSVHQVSMTSEGTQQNGAASSEGGMNTHKNLQNSERIEESTPGEANAGKDAENGTEDGQYNESAVNTFNYASKNDSNAELLNDFDFESFLNDAGDDSTQVFY